MFEVLSDIHVSSAEAMSPLLIPVGPSTQLKRLSVFVQCKKHTECPNTCYIIWKHLGDPGI